MNLWPRRRRRTPNVSIMAPAALDSPAFRAAWDQAAASVRDTYDDIVNNAIELDSLCGCGTPVDGPRHTIAITMHLLSRYDHMTVAKLLAEGILRDAVAKIEADR